MPEKNGRYFEAHISLLYLFQVHAGAHTNINMKSTFLPYARTDGLKAAATMFSAYESFLCAECECLLWCI